MVGAIDVLVGVMQRRDGATDEFVGLVTPQAGQASVDLEEHAIDRHQADAGVRTLERLAETGLALAQRLLGVETVGQVGTGATQATDERMDEVGQMLEGRRTVGDPSLSLPECQIAGLEGHHDLGFGEILDRNEEVRGVRCATNIEQLVEVERVVPGERGGDTAFGRPAANLSEHRVRMRPVSDRADDPSNDHHAPPVALSDLVSRETHVPRKSRRSSRSATRWASMASWSTTRLRGLWFEDELRLAAPVILQCFHASSAWPWACFHSEVGRSSRSHVIANT